LPPDIIPYEANILADPSLWDSNFQLKKSKFWSTKKTKGNNGKASVKSFAQATATAKNILKIREAFSALPNKKIIEIHNTAIDKPANRSKRIQITTKGPSRKQAIVPITKKCADLIMNETSMYVGLINGLLRSTKSNTCSEFIKPCPGSISIVTNNVSAPSDLSIVKKHFKSINSINEDESLPPHLSQSKPYLKITGILFIQPNGNKLTHEDIINSIQYSTLFEMVSLASKPRVIKALPKSDMAIVWIDIWDSQNSSKAKLLVNHSFNFSQYIATIRGTNMNPGILQCHNCWK